MGLRFRSTRHPWYSQKSVYGPMPRWLKTLHHRLTRRRVKAGLATGAECQISEPTCPWCQVALAEHPAERCLNVWVITVVLGFEGYSDDLIPDDVTDPRLGRRGHRRRVWVKRRPDGSVAECYCEECGSLPAYSTNIAAAWEVVEAMRSQGYRLKRIEYTDGVYLAFARERIDEAAWRIEQCPPDDEAAGLCRAALWAKLEGEREL